MYRCKSSAKNGTADGTSDTVSTTITVSEYPHSTEELSPTDTIMVNPARSIISDDVSPKVYVSEYED